MSSSNNLLSPGLRYSPEELDEMKFFFIIGRPRSGTTMLRTIMDAHSATSIPLESMVIVLLYMRFKSVKKWDEQTLERFYQTVLSAPKIGYWTLDKERLHDDIITLGEQANFQRLIKVVYLNYQSFFEKKKVILIGDKNPNYSNLIGYLHLILDIFPEAKFIHLVRDYRDHYLSMQRMNFEAGYLKMVCYRWRNSFVRIRHIFSTRPHQYYFLRYESLVSNPEKEVKELCDFLQLKFDAKMLDYHLVKDKVLKIYPIEWVAMYHSSLFKPISAEGINKWQQQMSQADILKADRIIGKSAIEAGYPTSSTHGDALTEFSILPEKIYSFLFEILKRLFDRFRMPTKDKPGLMARLYFLIRRKASKRNK